MPKWRRKLRRTVKSSRRDHKIKKEARTINAVNQQKVIEKGVGDLKTNVVRKVTEWKAVGSGEITVDSAAEESVFTN